jgi:hypothetical protein
MDRISVRGLTTAIRLIREPVVVTYSYPRSHPLYGAGEECGVFVPMPIWAELETFNGSAAIGKMIATPGIKMPDTTSEDDMVGFEITT